MQIRFIEFMPFDGNRWTSNRVVSLQEILETINQQYSFLPVQGSANDTAKHFTVSGHAGSFAVISTMSQPLCSTCNCMQLTADGKLKNCLFSTGEPICLQRYGEVKMRYHSYTPTFKAKQESWADNFPEPLTSWKLLRYITAA